MKIKYDYDEINRLVPIVDAISRYAGITITNPNKQFHCISPNHSDNKPSMSIAHDKNFCHCFACQRTYNPINLVKEFRGVDANEACLILIEDYSLPVELVTNASEIRNRLEESVNIGQGKVFVDALPLTQEECRLIGLNSSFSEGYKNPDFKFDENAPQFLTDMNIFNEYNNGDVSSKLVIEEGLLHLCDYTKSKYEGLIKAESDRFKCKYNEKPEIEWKKAEAVHRFVETHKLYDVKTLASPNPIKMTAQQLELNDAIEELFDIAERIADFKDICNSIDKINDKIVQHRNEREIAQTMSKDSKEQGRQKPAFKPTFELAGTGRS